MNHLASVLTGMGLAGICLLMISSREIVSKEAAALRPAAPELPAIYFSEQGKDSRPDLTAANASAAVNVKNSRRNNLTRSSISLNDALAQVAIVARSRHLEPSDLNKLVRHSQLPVDAGHLEHQVNLLAVNLCLDLYGTNDLSHKEDSDMRRVKKSAP